MNRDHRPGVDIWGVTRRGSAFVFVFLFSVLFYFFFLLSFRPSSYFLLLLPSASFFLVLHLTALLLIHSSVLRLSSIFFLLPCLSIFLFRFYLFAKRPTSLPSFSLPCCGRFGSSRAFQRRLRKPLSCCNAQACGYGIPWTVAGK